MLTGNAKLLKNERLTKKFLMQLPEGLYLTSNVYEEKGKPAFAENVSPLSERNKQWKRIVGALANNRLCNVFETKKDYVHWSKTKYCKSN